jgi:hypothetical protein
VDELSLTSASKARSSARRSHTFRPSILTGAGMRPSATSSSNFVAETPIYIADSSRDRPRRGTGLISESARTVIVTRPLRPAAGRLDPGFARDGLRAELRCGVAVFYPHIDVRGFDAECSIESLLRSPDWKVGRLRYCFFMKKGAAPKDSEPNMVAGIVSSIPAKIVVAATQLTNAHLLSYASLYRPRTSASCW